MVENRSGLPNQRNQSVGLISALLKKPFVQIGLGIVGLIFWEKQSLAFTRLKCLHPNRSSSLINST